jgi:hypothetical protein
MCNSIKSGLFILLATLGAALTVVPAHAQVGIRESVSIPFDFSVGSTQLKAGMYTIKEVQPGTLAISSVDGQQHDFALTFRGDSANLSRQPHLVFNRYGSQTFLEKVFLSSENDYERLVPGKREKELSKRQAGGEEFSLLVQPSTDVAR